MILNFFKMHTQGNDYIYFDFLNEKFPEIDIAGFSKKICNRHFGVGADGIVLILSDKDSDAFMRIFNSDGSEGKMCGSALMAVTSYLAGKTGKTKLSINTISGIKTGIMKKSGNVRINLGSPEFISKKKFEVENFNGCLISVGNKHFVTFIEKLSADIAVKHGPIIEAHPGLVDDINIEFVKILSKNSVEIKIWEHGSGETMACGTGACAVAFAGIESGLLSNPVEVKLPGGKVRVDYDGTDIFLTGEVTYVFSGSYKI